jgi:hypothetical protein
MQTKEILKQMLKENTGRALLDSGDAYGRNYEKNQNIDFDSQSRVSYETFGDGDILYAVSVYHYLNEILERDQFCNSIDQILKDNEYPWVTHKEIEEIIPHEKMQPPINTYNYDENISQTLLFRTFVYNDTPYVLLQIHGGCDVRGGYTDPRCFKLNGILSGLVDVIGSIDGKEVNNLYDGVTLHYEETGEEVKADENSEIDLDFFVNDETFIYTE